jgi:hypothetical protein
MSLLIEEEAKEENEKEVGIPICAANLSSPVTDQGCYIREIHYKIGRWLYIENAD